MTTDRSNQTWFQTDDAWESLPEAPTRGLRRVDVRDEALGLRFITSARKIDAFAARHAADFRPFTLFGSGDFHHLSAVWTRQFTEPFSILSFDNHPDWAITPPRWSCGAWVNRALENPLVKNVAIWGCGNFECNFPGRLLGNRSAAKSGRLRVHPWRQPGQNYPGWLQPIPRETWREDFLAWLVTMAGERLYITIDLDCLAAGQISTNWEAGFFDCNDIVWALGLIYSQMTVVGGDLCGAWSEPLYATSFQRLAGWFDHPKAATPGSDRAAQKGEVFHRIWPVLTGGRQ